jgi:hypothetical protein
MHDAPIARLADGVVHEPARDIPIHADVDVLVAGGGSAGWHAAVAAARQGARTLLIERHGTLGGTMTNAMVQPFMSYHNPIGEAVVGGVWQEMIDRLTELGGSTGPAMAADGNPPWGKNPSVTPFEPEVLRYVAQELVLESGAQLLMHTWVAGAIKEGDALRGLVVESKSGRQAILAKCVVDATGDADVAALAGAPFAMGREEDNLSMPMTLYVKMGGVDYDAIRQYVEENPDDLRWWAFPKIDQSLSDEFEKAPVSVSGFMKLVREARESGELYLGRETINILPCPRKGEAVLNCTRVGRLDPTRAEDLTTAEVEARRQAMSVVAFARRRMPGFQNAELLSIAPTIGVRESRRIVGEYVLNLEDVVECRRFDDVIAKSAYNVDIHNPHDDKSTWHEIKDAYDIPYRCLVPRDVENLLVAGRCISTTHEASGSVRMTPHVAATGEAAGVAAALAAAGGVSPRDIEVSELQSALHDAGAILGEPAGARD